jgi:hypothetical protein
MTTIFKALGHYQTAVGVALSVAVTGVFLACAGSNGSDSSGAGNSSADNSSAGKTATAAATVDVRSEEIQSSLKKRYQERCTHQGDTSDVLDWERTYEEKKCQHKADCCGTSCSATSPSATSDDLIECEFATFDRAAEEKCSNKDAESCTKAVYCFDSDYLIGKVPEGEPCRQQGECVTGLRCDRGPGATATYGICVSSTMLQLGETCSTSHDNCAYPSHCASFDHVCVLSSDTDSIGCTPKTAASAP